MPRQQQQQRNRKTHVNLAGLIVRAHHQSSHIPTAQHRSISKRGRRGRRYGGSGGIRPCWNTLIQPISILSWLSTRRTQRHVRQNFQSRATSRSHNNKNAKPASCEQTQQVSIAEVEMPCCTLESPTAEVQPNNASQKPHSDNTFFDPLSTVILHQNPLFDAEGNTRSGILAKKYTKSQTNTKRKRAKCVKNRKRSEKSQKRIHPRKMPVKKNSNTDGSSAASFVAANSNSTGSALTSENSKSDDSEESYSYADSLDLPLNTEENTQTDTEETDIKNETETTQLDVTINTPILVKQTELKDETIQKESPTTTLPTKCSGSAKEKITTTRMPPQTASSNRATRITPSTVG